MREGDARSSIDVLLPAGEVEEVLDRLQECFPGKGDLKAVVLKVESSVPTLNDAEDILRESRDPAELKAVWEGWRTVSPPMRADYAQLVALANEGSKGLGYSDTGALWRAKYDMAPDAFAAETDRVWAQVEPFYKNLHCYVRAKLNDKYGDGVQPRTGPIRADLLGNMWAQSWGNIYDIVAPAQVRSSYDLDQLLVKAGMPKYPQFSS